MKQETTTTECTAECRCGETYTAATVELAEARAANCRKCERYLLAECEGCGRPIPEDGGHRGCCSFSCYCDWSCIDRREG